MKSVRMRDSMGKLFKCLWCKFLIHILRGALAGIIAGSVVWLVWIQQPIQEMSDKVTVTYSPPG